MKCPDCEDGFVDEAPKYSTIATTMKNICPTCEGTGKKVAR